jgi:hypothetical protein
MSGWLQAISDLLSAPSRSHSPEVARRCGSCRHFRNDPQYLEAAIPGLSSFSSGAASVRADDGLCLERERYLSARASCGFFAPISAET